MRAAFLVGLSSLSATVRLFKKRPVLVLVTLGVTWRSYGPLGPWLYGQDLAILELPLRRRSLHACPPPLASNKGRFGGRAVQRRL